YHDKRDQSTSWKVNFFFGNSKKIKAKELNDQLFNRVGEIFNGFEIEKLNTLTENFISCCEKVDTYGLQQNWTNKNRDKAGPIDLVDQLGSFYEKFKNILSKEPQVDNPIREFIETELRNGNGKVDN